jgi:tetratricopeptide (TPR) repeat protein
MMRMQKGSEIISSIATTDTAFLYPENAEDMMPGNYRIKVLAVHNSDTLYKTTRSLIILDSLAVNNINQTIEMIAGQKPDDFTFYLLKAVFLRKRDLRLRAVETFKKLLAINPGSSILYKCLAELYYGLGIIELGDAFLGLSKQTITTPQIQKH